MMVQMAPMWIIAGLSAGWLAEAFVRRNGFGLVTDMALGFGGGIAGGMAILSLTTLQWGMVPMFLVGFAAAGGMLVAQRLCWPSGSSRP